VRKENVVSRNPKVMNGALVFSGTRVPVEILIQHLAAGDSLEDFLEGFPSRLSRAGRRLSGDDAGSSGCAYSDQHGVADEGSRH
jgi:hypothetical protein